MHPVLVVLLVLAALIAAALWWPVELSVSASLVLPEGVKVKADIRFFSGCFRLSYRLHFNLYEKPPLHLLLFYGEEAPRVLWRPGQEKKPRAGRMKLPFREIWRHMRLKRLRVEGALGVKDDAFLTVLLLGGLSALIKGLLAAACVQKKDPSLTLSILPDFHKDALRLNLEGIASCPPVHIISAILIWHLKNRKGQATVWRILSKTS